MYIQLYDMFPICAVNHGDGKFAQNIRFMINAHAPKIGQKAKGVCRICHKTNFQNSQNVYI